MLLTSLKLRDVVICTSMLYELLHLCCASLAASMLYMQQVAYNKLQVLLLG